MELTRFITRISNRPQKEGQMNVPPDNSSSEQTWVGSVMKANDPSVPLVSGFPRAGSKYSSDAGGGGTEGLVTSASEASVEPAKALPSRYGGTPSEAVMSDLTTTGRTSPRDSGRRSNEAAHEAVMQAEDRTGRVTARPIDGRHITRAATRSERVVEVAERYHPRNKPEYAKLCGFSVGILAKTLTAMRRAKRGVRCEYNIETKRWESTRENPKLAKAADERLAVIGDGFSRNRASMIRGVEMSRAPKLSRLGRERRKHLEELAAGVPGAQLVFYDPTFWNQPKDDGWHTLGEAYVRVDIAFVPHPVDRHWYLVGLHEIRHLEQPFVRKPSPGHILYSEMDADFYSLQERKGEIGVKDVVRVLNHILYRAEGEGAKADDPFGRKLIPTKLRDEYEQMLASCNDFLDREGYFEKEAA